MSALALVEPRHFCARGRVNILKTYSVRCVCVCRISGTFWGNFMSTHRVAAASRSSLIARRAAIFGAACAGLIITGGGQALASAGCDAVNAGIFNVTATTSTSTIIQGNFAKDDKLSWTVTVTTTSGAMGFQVYDQTLGLFAVGTAFSSGSFSYTIGQTPTSLNQQALVFGTGSVTVVATCTPAAVTSTPTDSQNLQTLQNGITKAVANVSGQVVTTQIAGAISDAFGEGGTPVTIGANGVSINFAATPKSDIEKRTDDAFSALGYAGKGSNAMAYKAPRTMAPYKEWSAWLDLRGTGWQNHDVNSGMNGAQFNGTGGIGRKLTPDLLVGVFGGYEYFKYNVAALAGEMKGTGGTIGSYLGWRMSSTVRFDAALGYTRMAYSATSGTASGSFNGDRLVASTGVTGNYGLGIYKIEPSASIYALWEKQSAWTDSLGTAQADRTFSAGRTSLGSKLIRQFEYGASTLAPYAGFYGDYRFSSDNATPGGAPIVGIGDGWSGRATAGVSWTARSGAALALGGELGGLGAAYKVWTGNIRASMPF
jgi:hypothetical protein